MPEFNPRAQRVSDFYATRGRFRIPLKTIVEHAGLNYNTIKNNLPENKVSEEKLTKLEESLIALAPDSMIGFAPDSLQKMSNNRQL
jgi:hypothetical protein